MSEVLRFMGVNKDTRTAGPGRRLEFFTKGCIRGVIAPCFGCFNEETWTFEGQFRASTVNEIVEICERDAWNRQVTFCGGEPILQARALTKVAKRLKEIDPTFHFVMYTAYKLDTLMKYGLKFTWLPKHGEGMKQALMDYSRHYSVEYESDDSDVIKKISFTILEADDVRNLMKYIDLIVDGDYQHDKRLTTSQYMHEGWFVGSANQRVIFGPASVKIGELKYLHADKYNEQRQNAKQCKCCGHEMHRGVYVTKEEQFCSHLCMTRYDKRKEEVKLLGGV